MDTQRDTDMVTLSVVIPAFNEGGRIARAVQTIRKATEQWCPDSEIIVVDDGSTDATSATLARMVDGEMPVRLFRYSRNRGKGAALRLGVRRSRGALVLLTDADLATPIGELGTLLAHIAKGADVAIGSRAVAGSRILVQQSAFRQYSGRVFNRLVRLTLLPRIADTQCGFKLFRGPVARALFAKSVIDGYAVDVEILSLAASAGFAIAEVPVVWTHMEGSKVHVYRDGMQMGRDLLAIWSRLRLQSRSAPATRVAPSESAVSVQ